MSMTTEEVSTTLYYDRNFDCNAAKIAPGEYYYTDKNMVIVTVLGSCVSACIRDSISGIGGMNHFMLPDGVSSDKDNPVSESMRYGTYAMEVLINQLLRNGAKRENLEAKIFGGGNVLKSFTTTLVGTRNAEFVKKFLKDERIRVTGEDLLDIYPRKVYFFPKTGKVLVKKLMKVNNQTLFEREKDYASKLKTADVGGEIDLF
jgi:chemotaxis protein CheD